MRRYTVTVRNSPGWRQFTAATLGVSIPSPNWNGAKFAAILAFAAARFPTIHLDVSDLLYRHGFMAEGMPEREATARAEAMGTAWLAEHEDIIAASPVLPDIVRWSAWPNHRDYPATLAGFARAHELNPVLREAVADDVHEFYRRRRRGPSLLEQEHSRNYLLEELAVITLQARALASVKLYPGDELRCLHVVRHGQVPEAPRGLEREQFARIKIEPRGPQAAPAANNG